MPLSDHEQRMLDQIEQALYAEDPKFANAVRATNPRHLLKRRVIKAVIGFVLGMVVLMVGVVTQSTVGIIIGVGGFVVMLACAVWGLSSWKRISGGGTEPPPDIGPGGRKGPRSRKPGFMDRMEERWKRRQDPS